MLVFSQVNNIQAQNFRSILSGIFFNLDINNSDTTLFSQLNSRAGFTPVKHEGWTAYAPTNDKGELIPYFDYAFITHPYFSISIEKGTLTILTNRDSSQIKGVMLSLLFTSKLAFDSTYQQLKQKFTKHSVQVIKRNVASPFEVTKYLSADGNFLILTKGESDQRPYIHLSYNYQGYKW